MVRIRQEQEAFEEGVELIRLVRVHRSVEALKEARDREVLRHGTEDITAARRAEVEGNRAIRDVLADAGLTLDRYERIMEEVRSDPVLHGIFLEAVDEITRDGSTAGSD